MPIGGASLEVDSAMFNSVKARILAGFGMIVALSVAAILLNLTLLSQIRDDFGRSQAAQAQKAEAVDMDLLMQKMRVRVNQWLRSMNPDFAKQADALLAEDVVLVAKARSSPGRTDREQKIVGDIDHALKAYVISWGVIQGFYRDEASIAERLMKPGVVLRRDLATLRDREGLELPVRRLLSDARDGFIAAESSALRYRASVKQDDKDEAIASVSGALASLLQAGKVSASPEDMAIVQRSVLALRTWQEAFEELSEVAQARVARLGTWTKNEGEAMAVGANALRVAGEEMSRAAENGFTATISRSASTLYIISGVILATGIGLSLFLARSISRPLSRMTVTLKALAGGDLSFEVPDTARRDEVGAMARAAQVFKENAVTMERMQADRETAKTLAETEKRDSIRRLATSFEASVRGVVDTVVGSSTEMQSAAQKMSSTAEETSRQSLAVSQSVDHTSQSVQTVASATEELSSSIGEIRRRVEESAGITREAVTEAAHTNSAVEGLATAAQRISEVVQLIDTIASQTNLLALNATIEAARAGESGKGFAVVASEVKTLANQTAKATETIRGQIAEIQSSTTQTVGAIRSISRTIGRIDEISSAIAVAMSEQSAATVEIASNIQRAAQGTSEIADTIGGVNRAASQTGAAAGEVLGSSTALSEHADRLRGEVDVFLGLLCT